ncbi:class I SAM-dependent methyltransferase [Alkalihalophilus pseudofirmus]|uniref:methyltransferase domain-containing protein n=1 Tax=Alkalihalophilus pseudofirmus TaxID=79885 RepID=UPI00259B845E|nr:class I SAM-dependent methyltransferase [Alkalihalophilus pseudofirmus]WEG18616.1 class I SAM-dependent methyltransferase [Alkalihalophilus pseudofirmus]
MKLDYGSGSQPKNGFLSSDFCGSPNYDYYIKDYKVLDAQDHSFDVIHCRNVIHHIPEEDLPILFAEFKRLLKHDGELIISEPRKEFHKQNLILDIIWYRFLTHNDKIMLPQEYVDYKRYLDGFIAVHSKDDYNNEVVTYKKAEIVKLAI